MGGDNLTIIVDPILRASRLDQTLEFVAEARRAGSASALVTRVLTDDERASLPSDLQIHEVVHFPDGFWFGHLDGVRVRKILQTCDEIAGGWKGGSVAVRIAGLNELLSPALIAGMIRYRGLSVLPTVAVHYDSNVILLKRPSWRRLLSSAQKRILLGALLSVARGVGVVYPDERVLEFGLGPRIGYKPDPFVHPFFRAEPKDLRSGPMTLLFVGRQDDRKGLAQLLALIDAGDVGPFRIRVVGPGNDAIPREPGRVEVRSEFVSNEDLWEEFSRASYVVLPYSRRFDSPSGVFVWAMVSGTPLIASDHGFLGYMVRKHGLGHLFDDRVPGGLADFLRRSLPTLADPDRYRRLSAVCIDYSQRHRAGSDAQAGIRQ